MMKSYWVGMSCGVLMFGMTGVASATLITYKFSGTGYRMFEHDGQTGINTTVSNSSLFGIDLANNSIFNASFTYDTLAIESSYRQNHPSDNAALFPTGLVDYQVNFGSINYVFDPYDYVQIWDDRPSALGSTTDSFSISANNFQGSDLFISSGFYIFDRTGQSQTGFSIPYSLEQISTFGTESFNFAWLDRNNGDQLHFNGNITYLAPAAPVPEPATMLLFGIGLAGLVGTRRRRKRNNEQKSGA